MAKRVKNTRKKRTNRMLPLLKGIGGWLVRSRIVRGALIIVVSLTVLRGAYILLDRAFSLEEVVIKGNRYVTDGEVVRLMGIKRGAGLLSLDIGRVKGRLMLSPWIEEAAIRKELPHKLEVSLIENEPVAILKRKGRLHLINKEGTPLERLKETVSFLPVISLESNRKGTLKEAIRLARVIRAGRYFENKDIEIVARSPEEITLYLDSLPVKIGKGDYEKKLSRLVSLDERLLRSKIPVQYIDLRFAKRVVVRPKKGEHESR